MLLLLLLLLLWLPSPSDAQSYHPCVTGGSCCYPLGFERVPGTVGAPLTEGYDFSEQQPYGSMGVRISTTTERSDTAGWFYPLALLNSSAIKPTDDWRGLLSNTESLVLVVAETIPSTANASGTALKPLRGSSTIEVKFVDPLHRSCLQQLVLLRSFSLSQRMGVSVRIYDAFGTELVNKDFPWSLQVRDNRIELPLTASDVSRIKIDFVGMGYGALALVKGCYPNATVDRCGICNGDSTACEPDTGNTTTARPGDACFNASMVNPLCQDGRMDESATRCVPMLLNVIPEVCNGIDDDCDGVIDNGAAPVNVSTCGVGACARTAMQCASGSGYTANVTCVPGRPTPETCNGVDDDCDGMIDEGHVCDRPVEGVAVVPVAQCVEGRMSPTALQCYAHFGWFNTDPLFDVLRPYGTATNALLTLPATDTDDLVMAGVVVPSHFPANSNSSDAFRVPINCKNGAAVWSIGDGQGNFLEAVVYASTTVPCEIDYAPPQEINRPISTYVDSPCITRNEGICQVAFGYYNPNYGAPAYYVPEYVGDNSFYLNDQLADLVTFNPPSVFFPQRVRNAAVVSFQCPLGTEQLRWQLKTAGVMRQAVAYASNQCD